MRESVDNCECHARVVGLSRMRRVWKRRVRRRRVGRVRRRVRNTRKKSRRRRRRRRRVRRRRTRRRRNSHCRACSRQGSTARQHLLATIPSCLAP